MKVLLLIEIIVQSEILLFTFIFYSYDILTGYSLGLDVLCASLPYISQGQALGI